MNSVIFFDATVTVDPKNMNPLNAKRLMVAKDLYFTIDVVKTFQKEFDQLHVWVESYMGRVIQAIILYSNVLPDVLWACMQLLLAVHACHKGSAICTPMALEKEGDQRNRRTSPPPPKKAGLARLQRMNKETIKTKSR